MLYRGSRRRSPQPSSRPRRRRAPCRQSRTALSWAGRGGGLGAGRAAQRRAAGHVTAFSWLPGARRGAARGQGERTGGRGRVGPGPVARSLASPLFSRRWTARRMRRSRRLCGSGPGRWRRSVRAARAGPWPRTRGWADAAVRGLGCVSARGARSRPERRPERRFPSHAAPALPARVLPANHLQDPRDQEAGGRADQRDESRRLPPSQCLQRLPHAVQHAVHREREYARSGTAPSVGVTPCCDCGRSPGARLYLTYGAVTACRVCRLPHAALAFTEHFVLISVVLRPRVSPLKPSCCYGTNAGRGWGNESGLLVFICSATMSFLAYLCCSA